jgi:hypothetical protein
MQVGKDMEWNSHGTAWLPENILNHSLKSRIKMSNNKTLLIFVATLVVHV